MSNQCTPAVEFACSIVPREEWSAPGEAIHLWAALRPGAEFPPGETTHAGVGCCDARTEGARKGGDAVARRAMAQALRHGPQIYAAYVGGRTLAEIGAALGGRNKNTVQGWLRRYCAAEGLPVPERGRDGS